MQAAAAQNDFITPAVVSAAEADYERNLANTVELIHMLTHRPGYTATIISRAVQQLAGETRRPGGQTPPINLQPIWSQPRVKVVSFADAFAQAKNRLRRIASSFA